MTRHAISGGIGGAELLGAPHDLAERLAVEVLHRDAVACRSSLPSSKTGATFGCEMRAARRASSRNISTNDLVLDEVRVDALDRDPLLEAARAVHAREVHARHAADADLVDDAVAAEEVRRARLLRRERMRARPGLRGRRAACSGRAGP